MPVSSSQTKDSSQRSSGHKNADLNHHIREILENRDWSSLPLGAIDTWPKALTSYVQVMLESSSPTAIFWGKSFLALYNNAWELFAGIDTNEGFGKPLEKASPEIWGALGTKIKQVFSGNGPQNLRLNHTGSIFSISEPISNANFCLYPIHTSVGKIGGIYVTASPTPKHKTTIEHRIRNVLQAIDGVVYEHFVPLKQRFIIDENWSHLIGVPPEDLPGETERLVWLLRKIHPEDRRKIKEIYLELLTGKRSGYHCEFRIKDSKNQWRWFRADAIAVEKNARGNIFHVTGVLIDLHEKKKAEIARLKSAEKYQNLVQHAPAALYEIDFQKQRFTSVNDVMCEITGFSCEELLQMDPNSLLDEDGQALFQKRLNSWLKGEKPDQNVGFRIQTKDGRWIDALLNVTFTTDEQGSPLGGTVIAHDITNLRQKEREIIRYNRILAGEKRIFTSVLRSGTEEDFRNEILSVVLSITDSQAGIIGEITPEGSLKEIASRGINSESHQINESSGDHQSPQGSPLHDLFDLVIKQGESFYTNNPGSLLQGYPELSNVLGVLLKANGKTIGLLGVANNESGYSASHQHDLESLVPAVVEALFHKRTEEALQINETKYHSLFNTLDSGFCILEIIFDGKVPVDFRIIETNPAFEAHTGLSNAIGQSMLDTIPDHKEYSLSLVNRVLNSGQAISFNHQFKQLGNRWLEGQAFRLTNQDKNLVAILFRDVTDRQLTQKSLQISEERLRLATSTAKLGIFEWDIQNDAPTWENHRIYEIFGLDPSENPVDYKTLLDEFIHPDDRDRFDKEISTAEESRQPFTIICRIKPRNSQEWRWIHYSCQYFFNQDGQPLRMLGMVENVTDEKQNEIALKQDRNLLQTIFDTIPVMLSIYDPKIEKIELNKHIERLTGWTADDTSETHIMDLVYPDPEYRNEIATFMQSLAPGFKDITMTRKDGSTIETSWANVEISDGRQVGIGIDNTHRRRTEEALKVYSNRLRFLHEIDEAILAAGSAREVAQATIQRIPDLMPDCIQASVTLNDFDEGKISLLAGSLPQHLNNAENFAWELPQGSQLQTIINALKNGEQCVFDNLQNLQETVPFLEQLQDSGAQCLICQPILIGNALIGTLNIGLCDPGPIKDELKEIIEELTTPLSIGIEQAWLHEETLERNRRLLETVINNIPVAVSLIRGSDLQIVFANPAYYTLTAGQPLIGRTLNELWDSSGRDFNALSRGVLESLSPFYSEDENIHIRRTPAGKPEPAYFSWWLFPVDVPGESEKGILNMVSETTERKLAEEALVEAERLTTIGRMAASLAHEINNPIQSVVGCLGLAREVIDEGEDASKFMDVAMEELIRASHIVQRMRDLRHGDQVHKRPTDIRELIDKVLIVTQRQAQNQNVNVIWNPPSSLPDLPLAADQIKQVFLNLVLNAIEAMPEGGKLAIRTRETRKDRGIEIIFEDTGVGIPQDEIKHLFEAFHSTKQLGLGLGLYVSHKIIDEHHGEMKVDSEPNKGTKFTVWLPFEASEPLQLPETE